MNGRRLIKPKLAFKCIVLKFKNIYFKELNNGHEIKSMLVTAYTFSFTTFWYFPMPQWHPCEKFIEECL